MNRLEMYINDLHKNSTDGNVIPTILNETPATAWVDGNNGLGAVVGNFCMDLAIQKAKTVGVGVVAAKRSNHYGIAAWYTLRAINLGMSITNNKYPNICIFLNYLGYPKYLYFNTNSLYPNNFQEF